MSMARRIMFGMLLAALGLLSAAAVEMFRLKNIVECGYHRQTVSKSAVIALVTW